MGVDIVLDKVCWDQESTGNQNVFYMPHLKNK